MRISASSGPLLFLALLIVSVHKLKQRLRFKHGPAIGLLAFISYFSGGMAVLADIMIITQLLQK